MGLFLFIMYLQGMPCTSDLKACYMLHIKIKIHVTWQKFIVALIIIVKIEEPLRLLYILLLFIYACYT